MNVSYIIPVLNSHEIVRRQILFWERMNLPDDVEIIIMDDGSDPPLAFETDVAVIHPTHETRPWTSSAARNKGAKIARGRTLLFADLDYIIPKDVLLGLRDFTGQRMAFRREFGVLDEEGQLTQDKQTLLEYGLLPQRYESRRARIPHHPNVYAMNRDVFFDMGGYDERRIFERQYPQGEDNAFQKQWKRYEREGKGKTHDVSPLIYMFPNGQFCGDVDYNPQNLFHNLSRKTEKNIFWHRQLRKESEQ